MLDLFMFVCFEIKIKHFYKQFVLPWSFLHISITQTAPYLPQHPDLTAAHYLIIWSDHKPDKAAARVHYFTTAWSKLKTSSRIKAAW